MVNLYKKETRISGLTIVLSAEYENINSVCQDVEKFLKDQQLQDFAFDIMLCIREALVNAIKHGSKTDSAKQVIFKLNLKKNQLIVKVSDEGPGFDWARWKDGQQDTTTCSGRGIKILKQYFNAVTFNKQGNEVELRKEITPATDEQKI